MTTYSVTTAYTTTSPTKTVNESRIRVGGVNSDASASNGGRNLRMKRYTTERMTMASALNIPTTPALSTRTMLRSMRNNGGRNLRMKRCTTESMTKASTLNIPTTLALSARTMLRSMRNNGGRNLRMKRCTTESMTKASVVSHHPRGSLRHVNIPTTPALNARTRLRQPQRRGRQ